MGLNWWDIIAIQPVTNVLIVLSHYLFNSFGLAIIALTIIINAAMLPLTLKQVRASKKMQELQPKLLELQKRYGKDKQRLAQEQMRLYKESGVSAAGCLLPMLIQMPVWFALYQSIMHVMAVSPESLLGLSKYLYPWPVVYSTLPLSNEFIGLNLAVSGNILLAVLVGGTMWLQQKMTMTPVVDPNQQRQAGMMQLMMPLIFGGFTLLVPSGLGLYWLTSNIIRIGIQYSVTGWGGLRRAPKQPADQGQKYRELK